MFAKNLLLSVPCLAGLITICICIGSEGFAPRPALADNSPQSTGSATASADITKLQTAFDVLERFRTFSGQRTPRTLSELFKNPVSPAYGQQPEIALSNGAITVSIKILLPSQDGPVPNFALIGARMISCTKNQKGEWLIEALPEIEAERAKLLVSSGTAVLEFPLVIAPPLPAETDLSEQGFISFLAGKDRTSPLYDLNGDGRSDYLDDYIFTANFLVSKSSAPVVPESAKQNPVVQDPGFVKGADKRQEPVREKIKPPQPAVTVNPDPHSLSNRNERARQLKQLLRE